jgi:hypothetical protein
LRQQKAPGLLEKIKAAIEAAKPGALPGGALEKACQYDLGLWPRLTCFLQYPELAEVRHLTPNSAIFEVESETSLVFAIAVLKKNQCSADLPS